LKQVDFSAAMHLAFHEFKLCDLSLGLAIRPRAIDVRAHRCFVLHGAANEKGDQAVLGVIDPWIERRGVLLSEHGLETFDERSRLDEPRDSVSMTANATESALLRLSRDMITYRCLTSARPHFQSPEGVAVQSAT
jgi:hypothetical protein